MSLAVRQLLIAASVGISMAVVIVYYSRRGLMSFRYTLGWLCVASLGILSGIIAPLAQPVARTLGLSSAALLGLAALLFVTVIAIQLSISISGLQRQIRSLTEEIARLHLQRNRQSTDGHGEHL